MAFDPLALMEPEETVGNLWHAMASGIGQGATHPGQAATLTAMRPSLAVLFRGLGGRDGVDLVASAAVASRHRLPLDRRIGHAQETEYRAAYDGERLRLPPVIDIFTDHATNRAAYLWLTALAALVDADMIPSSQPEGHTGDCQQIAWNDVLTRRALASCPGLRAPHAQMRDQVLASRSSQALPRAEADVEAAIRGHLSGRDWVHLQPDNQRGYKSFAPVPIWLDLMAPGTGGMASDGSEGAAPPPSGAELTNRKIGLRKDASEADRKDSFILHRFESILSWVESMNINRSVDDDDDENAQKAAEDQDRVTLSKHDRRAATRLRLHLDLSPADAHHERLSATFTYPEWTYRSGTMLPDHCRVLEAPAMPGGPDPFVPDAKRMAAVRRQFEALHPRRILRPRQLDGADLDLDAVIAARADLAATGQGSDRIYQSSRQTERDLSVAFLIDTSRSTEAAMGDTSVIDVARDALCALSGGIGALGDRFGIWGFSSVRRDRVFVTCAKGFDQPMSRSVIDNICALRPGHYTRLGTAIRHASAHLSRETATRKLLIVLTDGKPNDLDHYEGQHGIEDSHMAVREARRLGQSVHGIIVDEDGQDWFARIFGRGGFTLLPHPQRLIRALPDIYRTLTQET